MITKRYTFSNTINSYTTMLLSENKLRAHRSISYYFLNMNLISGRRYYYDL